MWQSSVWSDVKAALSSCMSDTSSSLSHEDITTFQNCVRGCDDDACKELIESDEKAAAFLEEMEKALWEATVKKMSVWQSSVWQSSVWQVRRCFPCRGPPHRARRARRRRRARVREDRAADAALSSATFAVLRRLTCPFVISIPQSSVWQSSVWQSSVWQSSVWGQSTVWCARSPWRSLATSPARCVPLIARGVG